MQNQSVDAEIKNKLNYFLLDPIMKVSGFVTLSMINVERFRLFFNISFFEFFLFPSALKILPLYFDQETTCLN